MSRHRKIYLALALTPILFSACTQEKMQVNKVSVIEDINKTQNSINLTSTDLNLELPTTTQSAILDDQHTQDIELISRALENNDYVGQNAKAIEKSSDSKVLVLRDDANDDIETNRIDASNDFDSGLKIESTKISSIIAQAKDFLGVKYVWAHSSPDSFDCSGFTQYVYKKNGVNLPRNSRSQARFGEKIASISNLMQGDLVFFNTDKDPDVDHVGIYLGDNKFIHASSKGKKVMINSFAVDTFYKNKFLWGARVTA